jgi:repressor LexA
MAIGDANLFSDSMIDAGIDNGDLVIIKKQNIADFGDIVVTLVNNSETTLKRYKWNEAKKRIYLHPENSNYENIYPDSLCIQGVAVKVLKNLK